jgi:ABC-2 type transport system permease protein
MSTQTSAVPEAPLPSQVSAPAAISAAQLLVWSVRREFWEHRSLYVAPLAATGLFLAGFLVGLARLPGKMRAAMALDAAHQQAAIRQPYQFLELLLMGTMLIVSVFYCIDALHGERRDRSILFWKSLPVSDVTTVLAKASIPLVILPLITVAITVVTQWVMLLLSSVVLLGSGGGVATLWRNLPMFQMSMGLLLHLLGVHGLWYAPFYGWLLLVSAWARRGAILWATVPLLAVGMVERIAFNTSYFATMLLYQFSGGPEGAAFIPNHMAMNPLEHVSLVKFVRSAGLWPGLAVTAVFLAAAIRLRRYREPM